MADAEPVPEWLTAAARQIAGGVRGEVASARMAVDAHLAQVLRASEEYEAQLEEQYVATIDRLQEAEMAMAQALDEREIDLAVARQKIDDLQRALASMTAERDELQRRLLKRTPTAVAASNSRASDPGQPDRASGARP